MTPASPSAITAVVEVSSDFHGLSRVRQHLAQLFLLVPLIPPRLLIPLGPLLGPALPTLSYHKREPCTGRAGHQCRDRNGSIDMASHERG